MDIEIHSSKQVLGQSAAAEGASAINAILAKAGEATIVLATGASQFEMLEALVQCDVDWSRVTAFHLDEYVGLSASHPASFRRYLRERVLDQLPNFGRFVMIEGDANELEAEVAHLNRTLSARRLDVCFAGIGENCHLAFNDPPADFATVAPYLIVNLDEACRHQQQREGWFDRLEEVPQRAISMSIREIMRSERLILCISDTRKAIAVRDALEGEITPYHPASIVQRHGNVSIHLDAPAAKLLTRTRA